MDVYENADRGCRNSTKEVMSLERGVFEIDYEDKGVGTIPSMGVNEEEVKVVDKANPSVR